jgi:radical SAM superfamily enzyme YgiQ (UPF0313 family)
MMILVSILKSEFSCNVDFFDLNVGDVVTSFCQYEDLVITSTPLDRWETPHTDYTPCLRVIRDYKAVNPKARVVLVGAHGTTTPRLIMDECPDIDVIVRGEPENVIRSLYGGLEYKDIKGISYYDGEEFVSTDLDNKLVDLECLPTPAYDVIDFRKYCYNNTNILPSPFTIIESSRGCPFDCIFCNKIMHGNKYRHISTEKLISEIKLLVNEYGVKSVYFQDLEFLIKRKRIIEFCNHMIAEKISLKWGCAARCKDINEEVLQKMKDAGCVIISFGVESLSDKVLTSINKKVEYKDIKRAKQLCDKIGIIFNAFTISGFPSETIWTALLSFVRAKMLRITYTDEAKVRPYPGTKLWAMAEQKGIVNFENSPWHEISRLAGKVGNTGSYNFFFTFIEFLRKLRLMLR